MDKITPHLWYDTEAREAAALYTAAFSDSRIKSTITLDGTPSGAVDVLTIDLTGHEFTLISAGPLFKFTPAISFLVSCETKQEVDRLWGALAEGGAPLMELGSYPFSERYGWIQDRYGLSWQLMFREAPARQAITPTFLFVGDVAGKANAAIEHWTSVFRNASVGEVDRYGSGEEPEREGTIRHGEFTLEGQNFAAMDSAHPAHDFGFNEAISLMVQCETQEEIDYYWSRLSADPKSEQCGWLKDKFGVSWQITPRAMTAMLESGDKAKIARVTEAFLAMKKFDLAKLEEAFQGGPSSR